MARNPLAPYRGAGLLGTGLDDMFSLHRDINRLFDQFTGGSAEAAGGVGSSILSARMNVSETDGEICIAAELPGVAEDDIDISLNDDLLTIRGEKKFEKRDERENYHFMERSYGTFQRSLRLPYRVDPNAVSARCENGVLTITIPKTEAEKRTSRIALQRGGSQQQVEQQSDQTDRQEASTQSGSHPSAS